MGRYKKKESDKVKNETFALYKEDSRNVTFCHKKLNVSRSEVVRRSVRKLKESLENVD